MMQDLRDEDVMLNYQKGEVQAMDELLRRYKNPVYHFAYRLVGNAAEAQDIAQEAFLRVHEHREDYEPKGKFSTWIFTITHNLTVSRLRKKKWWAIWPRRDDDAGSLVEFASSDPSPDDLASSNELSGVLKKCVQSLPFLQREALILREYQGLDYEEISKILHKSLGTVKTLIHRARQNLKVRLIPYEKEFKGGL